MATLSGHAVTVMLARGASANASSRRRMIARLVADGLDVAAAAGKPSSSVRAAR